MNFTHVKLIYFREVGKYYSEGHIDLPGEVLFHDALKHVADLLNSGQRPGLVDGKHFDVLVEVYTTDGPLPHLFVRDIDGYVGDRSMRVREFQLKW